MDEVPTDITFSGLSASDRDAGPFARDYAHTFSKRTGDAASSQSTADRRTVSRELDRKIDGDHWNRIRNRQDMSSNIVRRRSVLFGVKTRWRIHHCHNLQ